MAQYIDKNIVEEILRNLWKKDDGHNPEHRICYNKALQEVQCELDSIEAKEVDLEKEIKEEYLKHRRYGVRDNMLVILNELRFNKIAKYFFELGLKAQKGE